MTAKEFVRMYNGGKSIEEMRKDGEEPGEAHILSIMEDYAKVRSDWYRVNHISISTLIDSVLPSNSVLFKDGHECWYFYYDETDFDNKEDPMYSKELGESFADFIRRVVKSLIMKEQKENVEEPLVSIDLSVLRMEQ